MQEDKLPINLSINHEQDHSPAFEAVCITGEIAHLPVPAMLAPCHTPVLYRARSIVTVVAVLLWATNV